MKQFTLRLSDELTNVIDQEAVYNHMTRAAMIRRMLIAYLRPDAIAGQNHEDLYADPEELHKIIQQQKLSASVRSALKARRRRR